MHISITSDDNRSSFLVYNERHAAAKLGRDEALCVVACLILGAPPPAYFKTIAESGAIEAENAMIKQTHAKMVKALKDAGIEVRANGEVAIDRGPVPLNRL